MLRPGAKVQVVKQGESNTSPEPQEVKIRTSQRLNKLVKLETNFDNIVS
jgi:hypothetical protein